MAKHPPPWLGIRVLSQSDALELVGGVSVCWVVFAEPEAALC